MSTFIRDWSVIVGGSGLLLGALFFVSAPDEEALPLRPAVNPGPLELSASAPESHLAHAEDDFQAPFPGKFETTNGMWTFGKVVDRMRDETISEAYTISKSSDQNELLIRLQRKDGVTFKATLELHKRTGFAICGYDCAITISLDGKLHQLLARNHNPSATELEVFDATGFERLLKGSLNLFIELELDDGVKQYEFRTHGLDWSVADGAEPMFSS